MTASTESTYVASLIRQVSFLEQQSEDVYNDEALRTQLLQTTRRLTAVLEKPGDAVIHNAFLPVYNMCVRVGIDIGLFDLIAGQYPTEQPVTAVAIAEASNCEKLLIVRIMRVLVETGFAMEIAEEAYTATPLTLQMTTPASKACIKHHFDLGMKALADLPEYFTKFGYKSPTGTTDGPFQFALDTNLNTFEWWAAKPVLAQNFNTFMTGVRGSRPSWITWFPVEERLLRDAKQDANETLMVDIAGGRGHNLADIKKVFPHAPGRLILQDLPHVIDDSKSLDPAIEKMKHDMFDPQPIKGARIYYFHFVMHDWPDEDCRRILSHTAAAMTKGYSKLVLGEYCLPNMGAPLFAAGLDLSMMILHSGMERSEKQWRALLEEVGLEIIGIWPPPGNGDAIIEAVLK